jgi:hypothetical protein
MKTISEPAARVGLFFKSGIHLGIQDWKCAAGRYIAFSSCNQHRVEAKTAHPFMQVQLASAPVYHNPTELNKVARSSLDLMIAFAADVL